MKLTKTENIRVYEVKCDSDYEFIASKTRKDVITWVLDTYGTLDDYKIKSVSERELKSARGRRNAVAYTALKRNYERRQLPFCFWTTY